MHIFFQCISHHFNCNIDTTDIHNTHTHTCAIDSSILKFRSEESACNIFISVWLYIVYTVDGGVCLSAWIFFKTELKNNLIYVDGTVVKCKYCIRNVENVNEDVDCRKLEI